MTQRDQAQPSADHQLHDRLLVVRFAADDVHPPEAAAARAQIASCPDCAALVGEIRFVALATSQSPAPRRTRDFRLTQAQAERLRGSFFERLLRRLAAPNMGVLQPLAGAAVAVGLVLVIVGVGVPRTTGTAAPLPAATTQDTVSAPGGVAGATPVTPAVAPLPMPSTDAGPKSTPAATERTSGADATSEAGATEMQSQPPSTPVQSPPTFVGTASPGSVPPASTTVGPSATPTASASATPEIVAQPSLTSLPSPRDTTAALLASPTPGSGGNTAPFATAAPVPPAAAELPGSQTSDLGPLAIAAGVALASVGLLLFVLLTIARRKARETRFP